MAESRCTCDSGIKDLWGCDKPAQQAVWADSEGNLYYSCPILFIPTSILGWWEEYSYHREFNSSPGPMRDMPAKWLEAMSEYRKCLGQYDDAKPKKDDSKGLGVLRQTVKGRKRG